MRLKHLILLLFAFSISCSSAFAGRWHYIDPLRPSESFTIHAEPSRFQIDDVLQDAKICGKEDKYICIATKGFEFYVPKGLNGDKVAWTVNGVEYKANLDKKLQILGTPDEIYIIEKKSQKKVHFLYSKKRGLIGMGGFTETSSRLFLLAEKCGFGSLDCN